MILLAGHDEERNVDTGLFDDIHKVLDQSLHDIDRFCNADIVHALGVIGSQPGPHTSGQKYSAHLVRSDRLKSDLGEMLSLFFDLRDLHCAEGRDLSPLLSAVRIFGIANDRKVSLIDLGEELILLRIRQFLKMIENMQLSVFFK